MRPGHVDDAAPAPRDHVGRGKPYHPDHVHERRIDALPPLGVIQGTNKPDRRATRVRHENIGRTELLLRFAEPSLEVLDACDIGEAAHPARECGQRSVERIAVAGANRDSTPFAGKLLSRRQSDPFTCRHDHRDFVLESEIHALLTEAQAHFGPLHRVDRARSVHHRVVALSNFREGDHFANVLVVG